MEDQSVKSTPKNNEKQGKKVSKKLVIALMIVSLLSVLWFVVGVPYIERLDRENRAKAIMNQAIVDKAQRDATNSVRGINQ